MVLRLESGEQTIISPSILDLALPWTLIHPNRPNCTKMQFWGVNIDEKSKYDTYNNLIGHQGLRIYTFNA